MVVEQIFFNVFSSNIEEARAFYVDFLGLKPAFDSSWYLQVCSSGNTQRMIGILSRDAEIVPEAFRDAPRGGMLTLVVDDVDALHTRAAEQALDIVESPRNLFYGQRRMLLRDPDGTLVDVSTPCDPDSAWMSRVRPREDGSYVEG